MSEDFKSWFRSEPYRIKYSVDHPAWLAAKEAWDEQDKRIVQLEAELAECRNYIREIHSALSCPADENAVTYIQKTDQALVDRLMQVSTLKDENERLNASIETWRQMATPEKQLNDGFKAGMARAAEIEVAKPDVGVAIGAAEWLAGFRCGVRAKADAIRKEIK